MVRGIDPVALDRWLTTPPEDYLEVYEEQLVEALSAEFYETNEAWLSDYSEGSIYGKWLWRIYYDKDISPEHAAQLIERAHGIYIKNHPNNE